MARKNRGNRWRPQIRIGWILWMTLVVASFLAGRKSQFHDAEPNPIRVTHGVGVDSDATLTATLVFD